MVNMTYWKVALATAIVGGVALGCNAVLGITKANEVDLDGGIDAGPVDAGTPCEQYCTAIMQACTGVNQEYVDIGTCEAMCKHFEPGITGDQAGDSLACRAYHTRAAALGDPNFHCRHAGPLGGQVCGTDLCEAFCALGFALCQDILPYDGGQIGCEAQCTAANFDYVQVDSGDIEFPNASGGISEYLTGNTFNCRIYHLEAAYNPTSDQARTTHCPHIAVDSTQCR